MKYKIYPVYQGGRVMDIHDIVYRHPVGEEVAFAYGCFLLKAEDGNLIMVDSGAPSAQEIADKGYPLRSPDDSYEIARQLEKMGVNPADVKMVIYTHLHWDHAWNTELFPNAVMIAQKQELHSAVCPLKPSRKSYGFLAESGGPNWMRAVMQFQAVEGQCEILPGLTLIPTPGHTEGSQSVLIDTEEGNYLIPGDWIMNCRNLDMELPTGSTPDVAAWYQSLAAIRKLTLKGILPSHDPGTYSREYYG